jgi:hypothetical protein
MVLKVRKSYLAGKKLLRTGSDSRDALIPVNRVPGDPAHQEGLLHGCSMVLGVLQQAEREGGPVTRVLRRGGPDESQNRRIRPASER